ncbi:hypothetical protein FM106_16755 [Brachybacterium faecium]|nr:hypothetical protein FM106_16755 [Brachybacterium faecium]
MYVRIYIIYRTFVLVNTKTEQTFVFVNSKWYTKDTKNHTEV